MTTGQKATLARIYNELLEICDNGYESDIETAESIRAHGQRIQEIAARMQHLACKMEIQNASNRQNRRP